MTITWAEILETYKAPRAFAFRDDMQREEVMRKITEDIIETILVKLATEEAASALTSG